MYWNTYPRLPRRRESTSGGHSKRRQAKPRASTTHYILHDLIMNRKNSTVERHSAWPKARNLIFKANGIMRLLRQISLDGSNNARSSVFPFKLFTDPTGTNFIRRLSDTISLLSSSLDERNNDSIQTNEQKPVIITKDKKGKTETVTVLRLLEELNALLVYLIRLSTDKEAQRRNSVSVDKSKSRIRRQYSALVEGSQFFPRMRRSLVRQEATEGDNNNNNAIPSTSPPPDRCSSAQMALEETPVGLIEESIRKLIESKILLLLLKALPNFEFEEKKLIRVILTNAMILEVNKCHLVVDYVCEPSNEILSNLVLSYELGQSDVTLNCGCILRFASQYESIVKALIESDYFYNFFVYMKRSPVDYPFDVTMDVFYTFKTILLRHKATAVSVLALNPAPFFDAFIQLLRHADETENYVTKRQTLEVFANIFSGPECCILREKFIAENKYICPVIAFLWDRNLQIRLRCLVLINQLFCAPNTKDGSSALKADTSVDLLKIESENFTSSVCESDEDKHETASLAQINESESEPAKADEHSLSLLINKIKISQTGSGKAEFGTQTELEMDRTIQSTFVRLRHDCSSSSIQQFTLQIPFVDQVLDFLNVS